MINEQEVEASPLLLAEIVRPVIADIEQFLAEMGLIDQRLLELAGPVRERMLADEQILQSSGEIEAKNLSAVDAATVALNRQGLAIVLAAGVRFADAREVQVNYARRSGENTEDFRRVTTALRLMLEFQLLQDAQEWTIIDSSFWSLLMDSNQVMTLWRSLDSDELRAAFEEPVRECWAASGSQSFLRLLNNRNLIAISKTASSARICKEWDLSPLIPDRTLLSAILRPGEYTRPRLLKDMTEGHFGIERGIADYEAVERIYERSLAVSFYRPWEYQRAYRLEFHREEFPDAATLEGLLRRVKHETRERTIMEPISQFLADMVCKQISEAAPLYIQAAQYRYPQLMGPSRTGG